MYARPPTAPAAPGRVLSGLLAGFLASIIGVALVAGLSTFLPALPLLMAPAFAIPVAASAWLIRPASPVVPVLYVVLSIPGFFLATMASQAIRLSQHVDQLDSVSAFFAYLAPDTLPRSLDIYATTPAYLIRLGVVLLIVAAGAFTAMLFARSRARRSTGPAPMPGGPPAPQAGRPPFTPPQPGPQPPHGPYGPPPQPQQPPYAPQAPYAQQPYPQQQPPPGYPAQPQFPQPPQAPVAGPQPGPPPGARPGPPPGPPVPAAPPGQAPPNGPTPGGTVRLEPGEFDQLLYEQEQARREGRSD